MVYSPTSLPWLYTWNIQVLICYMHDLYIARNDWNNTASFVALWPIYSPRTKIVGACRAVWVPGQDLVTLHLMSNCGSVFCHYTVCYTDIWACVSTLMLYRGSGRHAMCLCVRSSWYEYAWFEITRAMPGYARVCRHLWQRYVVMHVCWLK